MLFSSFTSVFVSRLALYLASLLARLKDSCINIDVVKTDTFNAPSAPLRNPAQTDVSGSAAWCFNPEIDYLMAHLRNL